MITKELQHVKPMTGKERLGAFRNSEYMGAEDIESGTEPVLTIKALYNANITLARGKERHDVIVFEEESIPGSINQVRPLVVNATNRKTLRKIYKAVTADQLVGKRITLYLEHNVRDPSSGDLVDGIRIRPRIPSAPRTEPINCEDCGKPIKPFGKYTTEQMAQLSKTRFGRVLCMECIDRIKAEQEAAAVAEQTATEQPETAQEVNNAE